MIFLFDCYIDNYRRAISNVHTFPICIFRRRTVLVSLYSVPPRSFPRGGQVWKKVGPQEHSAKLMLHVRNEIINTRIEQVNYDHPRISYISANKFFLTAL